jgi:hypothetical protein
MFGLAHRPDDRLRDGLSAPSGRRRVFASVAHRLSGVPVLTVVPELISS